MSGYDRSIAYGGPKPTWWGTALIVVALAGICFLALTAKAISGQKESEVQARLCAGMALEWFIPATLAKVDCLSATHAIEVDWTKKWAESIGQALYYAYETGKEPGIVLVCKDPENPNLCLKHVLMTESTLAHWGLKATIWSCDIDTEVLDECRVIHLE